MPRDAKLDRSFPLAHHAESSLRRSHGGRAALSERQRKAPPAGEQGRPNIQMVKPQTPVVFGGRERHLHVQSIDTVAGVNGVSLNTVDSG